MPHAHPGGPARTASRPHTLSLIALLAGLVVAPAALAQAFDMKAAIGVYSPRSSTFWLDGDFDGAPDLYHRFGQLGDVGLLGDPVGSGSRAPVVFRDGVWLFDLDRDGEPDRVVPFGAPGDIPLMADMNGDGKDDLVVWKSNGQWHVNTSFDGTTQYIYQFGGGRGDVPLLGDMNGDGTVDLVIYNRGTWYVSLDRSSAVQRTYAHSVGSTETPFVFDFNQDGTDDLAVIANGTWHVKSVTGQSKTTAFAFGGAGDQPLYFGAGAVPNARADAARFLQQITFGATEGDIQSVLGGGWQNTLAWQFAVPHTPLPWMPWWPQNRPQPPMGTTWPICPWSFYSTGIAYDAANPCNCNGQAGTVDQCSRDVYSNFRLQTEFFKRAMTAPDQLRHRVAWALSQILVTSNMQDPIAYPMRDYQQLMLDYAFGRFEDLLLRVTLSPWMGNYLDMVRNDGSPQARARGVVPNENYARELLQLFSIGLWELKPDGTLLTDAAGRPIPTYEQDDIVELARALTGWAYPPLPGQTATFNRGINYIGQMVPIEGPLNGTGSTNYHDTGAKSVMDAVQPAGARADTDLRWAVSLAANHPNTGVYIGKQLIQQLVTSNPSPAYVARVSAVWNNNGAGMRGDLGAVVRAIVSDPEARAPRNPVVSSFGKLKEPALYTTNLLRALGATTDGVYLRTPVASMGQNIYNAPTVFNYYQQDFLVPGTEFAGPPFQIFDATSYFARVNFAYNLIYSNTCDTGQPTSPSVCGPAPDATVFGATGTKINWQPFKALATDPAQLVDTLSLRFVHETLPKAQRTRVINAVAAIALSATPTQAQLLDRVRMAAYLIVTSPKYQVEF
ncbi:MAG TPA: DUF1800 family protein [Casimicrobiaceae bacterium]|nr:DUF1800 family protein [Casimicrobiaceae bacterium]